MYIDESDVEEIPLPKKSNDVDVLKYEIDNLKQQLTFLEAVGKTFAQHKHLLP